LALKEFVEHSGNVIAHWPELATPHRYAHIDLRVVQNDSAFVTSLPSISKLFASEFLRSLEVRMRTLAAQRSATHSECSIDRARARSRYASTRSATKVKEMGGPD